MTRICWILRSRRHYPQLLIDEARELYGIPNHLSDANKLYYGIDWSRDGIRFQGDDKGIYDVTLYRQTIIKDPTNVDGQDIAVPITRPDYIPPQEASDKIANAIYSVDGKLMRFPTLLGEFFNDGWQLYTGEEIFPADYWGREVCLYKDGEFLRVSVRSPNSDEYIALESTVVVDIRVQSDASYYFGGTTLELPKGVTIGSSFDEVMALFTGLEPSINMQGKHTKCNLQLNNIKITIELLDGQVSFIQIYE